MSPDFALRLVRDRLVAGQRAELAPAPRVLYVLDGDATIRAGDPAVPAGAGGLRVRREHAWHGAGAASVEPAAGGATLLRYELVCDGRPAPGGDVTLEHAIDLDPARAWLMRCDRVEFEPGGVALPHGHRGGGIRCLVDGTLEVTVGAAPPRLLRPADAWFESGREPVLARASKDGPTAFIRVSILPREIRGQTSIVYVDPADAARSRPRRYTVLVDEPIELPA